MSSCYVVAVHESQYCIPCHNLHGGLLKDACLALWSS